MEKLVSKYFISLSNIYLFILFFYSLTNIYFFPICRDVEGYPMFHGFISKSQKNKNP